jgi:hypothetical protein
MVYNSPGLSDTTVLGLIAETGRLLLSVGRWSDLNTVLSRQGKYEQAEEMHRQILALRETVLGIEHPDTLTSMNNPAQVLSR